MMSHPDRATISHNENDLIHKSQRLLDSGEIEDPIEALRYLCLARGFSGFLGFGRIFRNMDQSGKRVLNLKQFTHAMEQTGFEFAHDGHVKEIFDRFDVDRSGGINIADLLESVRPEMAPMRHSIINAAFTKMDKEDAGVISLDVLKRYYNVHSNPKFVAGVQSEETILKQFVDHFQEHGDKSGVVTREDFDNYYAAISASVDNDMFFDLMVRQVYKL